MKKTLLILTALIIVTIFVSALSACSNDSAGLQYSKDGRTVTGYIGTESVVVIPDSVDGVNITEIGEMAFAKNSSITRLELGKHITKVGCAAFEKAVNLKELVVYSDNIIDFDCDLPVNLEIISVNEKSESYAEGAFADYQLFDTLGVIDRPGYMDALSNANCKELLLPYGIPVTINFSDTITALSFQGVYADYMVNNTNLCTYKTEFVEQCGITELSFIDPNYHYDCTDLWNAIPNLKLLKTYFGAYTAYTLKQLPSFSVELLGSPTTLDHGMGYYISDLYMPDTVITLSEEIFAGDMLSYISLSDAIEVIPKKAFYNCTMLRSVKFPANLTKIDKEAFCDCTSFSIFYLPPNLKIIEDRAFYNTLVQSVDLPEGLEKIYREAFGNTYIRNIEFPSTLQILDASNIYPDQYNERTYKFNNVPEFANTDEIGSESYEKCTFIIPEGNNEFKNYLQETFTDCTVEFE